MGKESKASSLKSEQKVIVLRSVAQYLERCGFSKCFKKLLTEAQIEKKELNSSLPDIEEVFCEFFNKSHSVNGAGGDEDEKKKSGSVDENAADDDHETDKTDKEKEVSVMESVEKVKKEKKKKKKEPKVEVTKEEVKKKSASVDENKEDKNEEAAEVSAVEGVEKVKKEKKKKKKEPKVEVTKVEEDKVKETDAEVEDGLREKKKKKTKSKSSEAESLVVDDNKEKSSKKRKRSEPEETKDQTEEDVEESKRRKKEENAVEDNEGGVQETPVKQADVLENGNVEKSGKGLSNSKEPKKPFQRVKVEEIVFTDDRLKDNSYWAKDGADSGYGAKAQEVLGQVRGRGFRHEKTKKKRGSYRGGEIDLQSHSVKFEYSDDE